MYKKIILILVLSFLLTPSLGLAAEKKGLLNSVGVNEVKVKAETHENFVVVEKKQKGAFCSKVAEGYGFAEKFTKRKQQVADFFSRKRINIRERIQKRDKGLDEKRDTWDSRRENRYEKLKNRAETDEQKEAVEKFIEAVEVAVQTRRSAIDSAIGQFRLDSEVIVEQAKTELTQASDDFEQAVNDAREEAKKACDNDEDQQEVEKKLREDISEAKESFIDKKNEIRARYQIRNQNEIRKALVEKAGEEFKNRLESAKEELKVAFGIV